MKCLQDCVIHDKDLNFDARYADDTIQIAAVFESHNWQLVSHSKSVKSMG